MIRAGAVVFVHPMRSMAKCSVGSAPQSALILAVLALAAASCGGGSSSSSGGGGSESIRGQTITVLVPYIMPQKLLDQFTAADRRQGQLRSHRLGRDPHKLIVANTAKTYIADVAEFDWSFTGQFAGAGWVEPLDNVLPASLLADLKTTDAAFQSGRQDLRGLLLQRLPRLDVQQEDVRPGGHRASSRRR